MTAKRATGTLEGAFAVGDVIGEGSFATVHRAVNINGLAHGVPGVVAVKLIDKARVESMTDVEREVGLSACVQHQHLLRLYAVYETPATIALVMELATGGPLADDIMERGRYSERDASQVSQRKFSPEFLIFGVSRASPAFDSSCASIALSGYPPMLRRPRVPPRRWHRPPRRQPFQHLAGNASNGRRDACDQAG